MKINDKNFFDIEGVAGSIPAFFRFPPLRPRIRDASPRGSEAQYTGADYITHPEVVAILRGAGIDDEATLAAAWLHDVVEDTSVKQEQILVEFGPVVCAIVSNLTNVGHKFGNRATRTRIDR